MTQSRPPDPPLPPRRRLENWDLPLVPILVLLSGLLLVVAAYSLRWDLCWDALDMNYLGFLINKMGRVPYRDIFDPNMPGTMLLHSLLTRVFGYTDAGARLFDLLFLAALAASTARLLRRFDWRVRWLGAIFYPWLYFARGEYVTLQRDHLLILPIVWATLVAGSALFEKRPWLRGAAMGALVGLGASLKPQAVLWLGALLGFEFWRRPDARTNVRAAFGFGAPRAAGMALGFAAPLAVCGLWLWAIGGLDAFLEMARHWWPYHTHMFVEKAAFLYAPGAKAWKMRFEMLPKRFPLPWLFLSAPAAIGLWKVWRMSAADSQRRGVVGLALAGAAIFALTVVLVGQPHPYVWLPLGYFLTLLAAFGAGFEPAAGLPAFKRWAPLAVLLPILLGSAALWPRSFVRQAAGRPPQQCMGARPREIAAYLKERAAPGDAAQFMDWFGGGTDAAWRAQIDTATRYYVDYQFYVHPSSAYVKGLQDDFLKQLAAAPPRFFIRITANRNQFSFDPADRAAVDEFEARLRAWLSARYAPAHGAAGYTIYERRP
jgi:hypothetical protein